MVGKVYGITSRCSRAFSGMEICVIYFHKEEIGSRGSGSLSELIVTK